MSSLIVTLINHASGRQKKKIIKSKHYMNCIVGERSEAFPGFNMLISGTILYAKMTLSGFNMLDIAK